MTTIKETKYICNDCGKHSLYHELIKKKTMTTRNKDNYTERRYQHSCKNCHCRKFKIISIVKD